MAISGEYRIEHDLMGAMRVPKDAYYGVQTLRAVENFPISGHRVDSEMIVAIAQIKKAAAMLNANDNQIPLSVGKAICQACDEIISGKLHDQFLVDSIQGGAGSEPLSLSCREDLRHPGTDELPIAAFLDVPAELTVSIYAEDGTLVRRLAASLLTRPTRDGVTHLYWDGRDDSGEPVPQGRYVIAAEARVGGARQKAVASVSVSAP